MFHRVIVKRFDSFLLSHIVRVGLGRAERVLQFRESVAEEAVQLRLDLFGVFRLFDRFLHFVVRFRRGLFERIHELSHLALSRLLQTIHPLLLRGVCRAATLNNQNKPHGFFFVFCFLIFKSRKQDPNLQLNSVYTFTRILFLLYRFMSS